MTRTTALALQVNVPQYLENTVADIVAFLPRLVAALVVLLIGWVWPRAVSGTPVISCIPCLMIWR
jgi:hypothetical protein